jgi:hypothetical protein
MNRIRFGWTLTLFASLACSCALAGQESGTPTGEPNKHREVSPPPRQPEVNSPRSQEENPPKHEPEAKPPKTEKQEIPQPSKAQKRASAQPAKARPAGKSMHVPDPQFKAHFGKQHTFTVNRVVTTTTIMPNQTQFVYAGYTFIFLDPWPEDWLFTDDCYIDYVDDEYFLFDMFHPGIRVALFVVG